MNRTFVSLWVIGALTSITRWLELLVTSVVAFDLTGSAFDVALLTLVRMAPLSLFGVPMGVFAERSDRRLLFTLALIVMVFCSLAVTNLVRDDALTLWHLGFCRVFKWLPVGFRFFCAKTDDWRGGSTRNPGSGDGARYHK